MATLTLDLPEAPRPQAAYRLAADCPRCGAPLVLRQNRQTGALFTGCSAYPGCAFAEPHDPRVQTLSTVVIQAVQTLATQVTQAQTAAQRQVAQAQAETQRQLTAEREAFRRTVRQLIALAHPDRWPDTPLAHELTVALVALRETLRPGVQGAPPAGRSRTAGRPWRRTLGGAHHAGDRGLWHGATQARRTLPALVEAEAHPGQRRRSMMGRHRSADKTSEESDRGETAHGGGRLARQHGIRDSESRRARLDRRCHLRAA